APRYETRQRRGIVGRPNHDTSENFSIRFRVEARRRKGPPKPLPTEPPYIVRLLDQAVQWQRMIDDGEWRTRAELAVRFGVTAARVSQVLALLNLNPRIQTWIRSLPPGTPKRTATERGFRALARLPAGEQVQAVVRRSPRAAGPLASATCV